MDCWTCKETWFNIVLPNQSHMKCLAFTLTIPTSLVNEASVFSTVIFVAPFAVLVSSSSAGVGSCIITSLGFYSVFELSITTSLVSTWITGSSACGASIVAASIGSCAVSSFGFSIAAGSGAGTSMPDCSVSGISLGRYLVVTCFTLVQFCWDLCILQDPISIQKANSWLS